MKIPAFEVQRMIEKAFENSNFKASMGKYMRNLLTLRYLDDRFRTYEEVQEILGNSVMSLMNQEQRALNSIRRYLKANNLEEYITFEQPTV